MPSEWAERFAYVPPEGNAEPGKWTPERMPWQAAMLDDLESPAVNEVFWRMASQYSGKTLMMIFATEYFISYRRQSVVLSRDTQDRAKTWMRDKFDPTVAATPVMDGILKKPRSSGSESTVVHRKYPGGSLNVIGAKSDGAFRSYSAPNIFQDEVSSYEANKEGDPCKLIDRGSKTFASARKLKCSTPTLKGFCRITSGYESGDQQKYFVPCPCCGAMQPLDFFRVKFSFSHEESARIDAPGYHPNSFAWQLPSDPTDPSKCNLPVRRTADAIYVCANCQHGWTDAQRMASILSGHPRNPAVVVSGTPLRAEWRATAPFSGTRSRDLEGTYGLIGLNTQVHSSYLHRWAEEFISAAKGGTDTLMAWWNMFYCKEWEDRGEKIDWASLPERAEDYDAETELPPQCVWWDIACDVQENRVEALSLGYGEGDERWVLAHDVFWGDFDMPEMQDRVWAFLHGKTFKHPILGPMPWAVTGIDCGHQTRERAVYKFCGKHRLANVNAVRGYDEVGGAIYRAKKEKVNGGMVIDLATDYLKTTIFDSLRKQEPGAGFIHFPKERDGKFGPDFYAQICSEKRVMVRVGQGHVRRWVKNTSSVRNEVLDMLVYAHGLAEFCRDWRPREIAERWARVKKEIATANPPERVESRTVTIGQAMERKQPDLVRRTFGAPRRVVQFARPIRRF
jgi:phage terminase large subunit GpA-like protein